MKEENIYHPTWIEVDLKQLKENIAIIKKYIGKALYCFPIKANAYGHGLVPVAKVAAEAGVDYLAVAHLKEAVCLRNEGINIPILVLGAIHEEQILELIAYDLEFSISSRYKADLVHQKVGSKRAKVHIEVDTGMHRTGVRAENALALMKHMKGLNVFDIRGIYSHFSVADQSDNPFTEKQVSEFRNLWEDEIVKSHPYLIRHIANSGGVVHFPHTHLDMVRPAFLTLGYLPKNAPRALQRIKPCFALKARISYFKVVKKGQGISYGHMHITDKETRMVTIPLGYGDGYRRALSNKGSVLIRGKRYPIRGAICMDQFMVDIGQDEAYVGDTATLIGEDRGEKITLEEIAYLCDTIPYEILCLFNDRIPRLYK